MRRVNSLFGGFEHRSSKPGDRCWPVLTSPNGRHISGQPTLPGTVTPKTWLGVPMLVADQVKGILSLQNVEQEYAFSDSDVRLLQTFAASLSVALENARLFDETQRLLIETEQRAAELQIINNIQEGLAQKPDTASIYDLVGNKIRELYPQADLFIGKYESETDELSIPYLVESNSRKDFHPLKVDSKGFMGYFLKNPHTLLINREMDQAVVKYQSIDATGAGIPKSALYVPLMCCSVIGEMF